MPTLCRFQLDRLNPVYNSGEYVTGRILLKTGKVKRVNAIYVTLEGQAKVQWSISGKGETANYYFGHQQYLYTRTNVFDSSEFFRAGTHVYVLSLRIPLDCPSSCEGPYGYIAYNISLTIDKPWSLNEVFIKPVTVVQILNLNNNPEFGLPVHDENSKFLCNWPCSSGPICSTLLLPFTGYTPTQSIKFILEVDNQSPHYDIHSVEAALRQHFVFLARRPLKRNYYTRVLAKSDISEHTLRLSKRLYKGSVCVPEDTPRSTLNNNYIVFLHYTLQVKLKTGQFHRDLDIAAPVVIGTVPLRHQNALVTMQPTLYSRELLNDSEDEVVEEQTATEGDHDEPPTYDSCLPPSFSFATLGSQQTLESSADVLQERKHLNINLPKFPGYNTFAFHTQAANNSSESDLQMDFYDSFGSISTDRTGASVNTSILGSSCNMLSEHEDNASEAEHNL